MRNRGKRRDLRKELLFPIIHDSARPRRPFRRGFPLGGSHRRPPQAQVSLRSLGGGLRSWLPPRGGRPPGGALPPAPPPAAPGVPGTGRSGRAPCCECLIPGPLARGGVPSATLTTLRPLAAGSARRDFFLAPQAASSTPPHRPGSPVQGAASRRSGGAGRPHEA